LIVGVAAALFSREIISSYREIQTNYFRHNISRLVNELTAAGTDSYPQIAQSFLECYPSFHLLIKNPDGQIVFSTGHCFESKKRGFNFNTALSGGYTITAHHHFMHSQNRHALIKRSIIVLVIMFSISLAGAMIFASQITRPIKCLVKDAKAMSLLAPVAAPVKRSDEIDELAVIIYEMYNKLKDTITALEEEKEAQQYFFAAASHELKTPIAATTVLLQGMFDNIFDYQDREKYLWECLKMMDEQNRIVKELLEIIKYADGKIKPKLEIMPLRETIDDLLSVCRTFINEKGLSVVVQIPEEERCIADDYMLKKALSNIILNALQHSDGKVRIWTVVSGDFVRLCFLNTGAKIDENLLLENMLLFKPFERMDKARICYRGRIGLGLTIAAKMLDNMEAAYALVNVPEGVLFWMELPAG
ncbi:MAG: HAMP domain-containing histidine kinase, partial [Bacteroidetes bacterium]|nr:HAMP domain-containing histidine kinase [Bacteroidota bacterium]